MCDTLLHSKGKQKQLLRMQMNCWENFLASGRYINPLKPGIDGATLPGVLWWFCRIQIGQEHPAYRIMHVDKMKVSMARIITWPWLASSLHTCGWYVIDSAQCSGRHNGMAAGEQRWDCSGGQTLRWRQGQRGPEAEMACCLQTHSEWTGF